MSICTKTEMRASKDRRVSRTTITNRRLRGILSRISVGSRRSHSNSRTGDIRRESAQCARTQTDPTVQPCGHRSDVGDKSCASVPEDTGLRMRTRVRHWQARVQKQRGPMQCAQTRGAQTRGAQTRGAQRQFAPNRLMHPSWVHQVHHPTKGCRCCGATLDARSDQPVRHAICAPTASIAD